MQSFKLTEQTPAKVRGLRICACIWVGKDFTCGNCRHLHFLIQAKELHMKTWALWL